MRSGLEMGSEQHYCLRWNNHQSNLLGVFSQLLRDESLVDVTLACSEGHSIRAHKVVLSACSSYFQTLFVDHPSRHPIVILKDVRFSELRTLIEFMYKGEVDVEYCQLSALLKTAESLKIKGLAEMTNLGPSSREYKQEPETEQTEPTELVNKRPPVVEETPPPPPPARVQTPPPSRPCRSPDRPASREPSMRSLTPVEDCGPSDMSMHNSNPIISSCSSALPGSSILNRLPSPINSEPLPGPSGLPPVQQVPLSLMKKEVDWGGGSTSDDKNTIAESLSEYPRHSSHDSDLDRGDVGSPRLHLCMYCGLSFPHQSKLTRHILSHSLETLKYREQLQHHPSKLGFPESFHLMESHFSGRGPPTHPEPPDPTDQPPTPMDFELVGDGGGSVACDRPFKCDFCGKAFKLRHHMKDHCRVHTGERPFRCSLCGKTFSRSTILKAHEKTHFPKYVRKFLSPSPLDTEEESPH